jgi:DNA-binding response OmpR family regulator
VVNAESFDILHYLLENAGRLVSKDELVKTSGQTPMSRMRRSRIA